MGVVGGLSFTSPPTILLPDHGVLAKSAFWVFLEDNTYTPWALRVVCSICLQCSFSRYAMANSLCLPSLCSHATFPMSSDLLFKITSPFPLASLILLTLFLFPPIILITFSYTIYLYLLCVRYLSPSPLMNYILCKFICSLLMYTN